MRGMNKRIFIAALGAIALIGAGCGSADVSRNSSSEKTVQTTVRVPQEDPPEPPPNIPPPTYVQNGHATE